MPSNSITIRRVSTAEEFENLESKWNTLFAQNHIQSAFLTWAWLFSWWTVYREGKELWIITAWQDKELVGILPLMLEEEKENGFTFQILRSLGSPQSDVGGALVKESELKIINAMSQHLIAQQKKWDVLELNYFREDDPVPRKIKMNLRQSGMASREKVYEHFYVPLEKNWEHLLSQLSRKFRKNLRRAARGTAKAGEVKLKHFAGEKINWAIFQEIIKINQYAPYPLLANSPKEQSFHKELQKYTVAKKILTVFILFVNAAPVAYEYGFVAKKRYEAWRAGYDTRFDSTVSVGNFYPKW